MQNLSGAARACLRTALLGWIVLAAGCASTVAPPAERTSPAATQATPRPFEPPAPVLSRPATPAAPLTSPPAASVPPPAAPAPPSADGARPTDAESSPRRADAAPAVVLQPPPAAARHADLWARIRDGFAMPELDTPLVAEKERFYLARPEALQRMFARGGRYLHFIVEEVERRGMPTELALLPFVESAMNPVALSPAKASGLWQFIPSTGRQYELSQNWWVDNRRDVVQSTRAALEYLQKIYEMHDRDWFLALASYNWGENAVARAVKNNRARGGRGDYLSLSMPNETRHYVPKLIALKQIVMRADALGIALPDLPNRPYFATIEKTRPIDLKLAAQFAGMPVEEFVALNPAHNRPVIAASRNNEIKIPADRIDAFVAAVERHDRQNRPLASWQPYTLKPGESVEEVARRGSVSVTELLQANGLGSNRQLLAGTQLIAPQASVRDERLVESFEGPRVYERVSVGAVYHRVQKRDTLPGIASNYGVSVAQLRAWNGVDKGVKPGASLLVRPATTQTVLTTADGGRQVVARAEPADAAPSRETGEPRRAATAVAARPTPTARAATPSRSAPVARAGQAPASVKAVYRPPRPTAVQKGRPGTRGPRT